jgi:hypothetical protein
MHELDQALPECRSLKQIAHRVVKEHRIELPQCLRPEHFRITADHGLVGARLLSHPRKRVVRVLDRPVPAVINIQIEDQQPTRLPRTRRRLGRQRLFDPLAFLRSILELTLRAL